MKNKIISIVSLITLSYTAHSQDHVAPTLQVGLGGVGFSQGVLDQELIMEIIGDKQDELKEKAIKYMLLKRVMESGSTVYGYVDNTIETIRTEKDPQIRTRNIVENSINFVFATTFSSYIYQQYKSNKDLIAIFDIIKGIKNTPYPNLSRSVKDITKYKIEGDSVIFNDGSMQLYYDKNLGDNNKKNSIKMYENYKYLQYNSTDCQTSQFTSLESVDMEDYNAASIGDIKYYENSSQFITYLFDMSSVILSEDQFLKKLGVLKSNYISDYKGFNKYINAEEYFSDNIFELDPPTVNSLISHGKALKTTIQDDLKKITRYAGLLSYIEKMNNLNVTDIEEFFNRVRKTDITDVSTFISGLNTSLKTNLGEIDINQEFTNNMTINAEEIIFQGKTDRAFYKENITVIQSFVSKINNLDFKNISNNAKEGNDAFLILSDLLFELNLKVIPALNKVIAYNPKLISVLSEFDKLTQYFLFVLDQKVEKHTELLNTNFSIVLAKLYQFDKASTISEYITLLNDVSKMIKNNEAQTVINMVTSFTNRYMKVEKDKDDNEVIDFDIEGYLFALKSRPTHNGPFEFHFTVGTNTGLFHSFKNGLSPTNFITSSDTISSLTYISEKIGVKIKIKDWKHDRSFNKGDVFTGIYGKEYKKMLPASEPIVSNFHVLLYGSGILYNITNTTTNNEFTYPLIGGGLGLTFFNGLDFNITASTPVLNKSNENGNINPWLFSAGFDIQFTEYITQLNKKRKEQKQAKNIAKALGKSK